MGNLESAKLKREEERKLREQKKKEKTKYQPSFFCSSFFVFVLRFRSSFLPSIVCFAQANQQIEAKTEKQENARYLLNANLRLELRDEWAELAEENRLAKKVPFVHLLPS